MSAIIVIRHAQPADCQDAAASHWIDTELTPLGRRQAQCVADRLAQELAEALPGSAGESCVLYSSDLRRASQTAEAIGQALGLEVVPAPQLREFNNGLPPGKAEEDLRKYVCEPTAATRELLADPRGETWPQFYGRVAACMDRLTAGEGRLVLVVAHYGTICNILTWWLGLGLTAGGEAPVSFEAALASIAVLKRTAQGKPRLDRLNDAAHLRQAGLDGYLRLAP